MNVTPEQKKLIISILRDHRINLIRLCVTSMYGGKAKDDMRKKLELIDEILHVNGGFK